MYRALCTLLLSIAVPLAALPAPKIPPTSLEDARLIFTTIDEFLDNYGGWNGWMDEGDLETLVNELVDADPGATYAAVSDASGYAGNWHGNNPEYANYVPVNSVWGQSFQCYYVGISFYYCALDGDRFIFGPIACSCYANYYEIDYWQTDGGDFSDILANANQLAQRTWHPARISVGGYGWNMVYDPADCIWFALNGGNRPSRYAQETEVYSTGRLNAWVWYAK